MIKVTIEVSVGGSDERCEITSREGETLEDLGNAIGRAIGGIWNAVEYCSGDELRDGMEEFLPDDLRMKRDEK